MQYRTFLTSLIFLLLLFSCNKTPRQEQLKDTQMAEISPDVQDHAASEVDQQVTFQQPQLKTDSVGKFSQLITKANADWDKKIIKTATMRLEVTDFKNFNALAHNTVKQFGGYVAQEDNNLTDYSSETTLSIKVPVNNFEDLMNRLNNENTKLLERKITTDDITGEVIDTKSRLEAKKEMRIKYLEFLKQSKNMKEVLEVQSEINNIQEEIESATGRLGYLTHQAAYSTINLTYFQLLNGYKPGNNPPFYKRISNAFKGGAEWIKNIFIGLVYIWPLILLLVFGVFLLRNKRTVKAVSQG